MPLTGRAFFLAAVFLPSVLLGAPLTAYEALISVGRAKGNAFLDNLIEMRGLEGSPQPQQWTMIFRDASARGGLREFVVTGRGIASERTPLRTEDALLVAPTMPYGQLKMDSSGAFAEANRQALSAKLGFDSVTYVLRSASNTPAWNLRLFDASRRQVGALSLSAKTGAVISRLAKAAPAAGPTAEVRPLGERWVEGGGLVGHMTRWSERTWGATTNAATSVGRSVETFFVGKPADAQPANR